MSHWKEYKLGEIANIITGFPFMGSKYSNEGIRVIRGENVTIGNIRWDTIKCWNEEFEQFDKYSLREGDIVIGMDGSRVGKNRAQIRKSDLPLLLAQRVARVRAKEGYSQDLLAYIIKSNKFEEFVSLNQTGTSIPHISQKQIEDFDVSLIDDLPTQTAIASILSSLDQKIELNNAINRNLEALAQALFKQWFVEFEFPVDQNGNISPLTGEMSEVQRGYKESGGEMVESELGMIPKGWEIKKISELCDVTDYVANGSFASLAENVKYKSERDYAILIRLTDYNRNYNGDFVYVDESAYNFLNKSKLFGGEIIIANVGANAGTVFRAPFFDRPMTLGPNSIMIKNNDFTNYLYLYLVSVVGQYMINGIISGSAQPKFNKTDFRKIEVISPNIKIIQKFNELYTSLNEDILLNIKQIQNLIKLRDILLPKLISGELEVKDV